MYAQTATKAAKIVLISVLNVASAMIVLKQAEAYVRIAISAIPVQRIARVFAKAVVLVAHAWLFVSPAVKPATNVKKSVLYATEIALPAMMTIVVQIAECVLIVQAMATASAKPVCFAMTAQ